MQLKSVTAIIAVLIAASSCVVPVLAAQAPQEPSIADAARLNREQKKSAAKSGTVITNDTLSPSPTSTPAATPPAGAPATAATSSSAAQTSTPAESPASNPATQPGLSKEDSENLKAEIATIKQELKDKQSEVDLLQRLLNLDREALLSKPDSSRDSESKAKIDTEQQELTQKTEEFEKLKAKLQSIAPELTSTQAPPKS
jgi:hypothetical protein